MIATQKIGHRRISRFQLIGKILCCQNRDIYLNLTYTKKIINILT